jgi:flagellar basal-body rod protein FlgC
MGSYDLRLVLCIIFQEIIKASLTKLCYTKKMLDAINTALSGLLAQGQKAGNSANNIANAQSTGQLDGRDPAPYTPVDTALTAREGGGVDATTLPRQNAFTPSYEPNSPFANEDGYIGAPNVSLEEEIVNLKQAELAYKANLKTVQIASELQDELLDAVDTDA